MTVSLSEVGRSGRLDLTFAYSRGRTIVRNVYCEVPYKITRLHDSSTSGLAHLILMHCTAGLFGGDVAECTIRVEAGARVRITQQSATKIHPCEGKVAIQTTRIHVAADGELHVDLDPVIPFAGSRTKQSTRIDVDAGARVYLWEGLMAGRVGHGEAWQFEEFCSETLVRVAGRLLYLDRFRLAPREQTPNTPWMLRDSYYLGSGVCVSPDASELASRLHERLPHAGVDMPEPGLVTVRAAAKTGPEFHLQRLMFTHSAAPLSDPLESRGGLESGRL
jgi:urease accessory protein